MECKLHGNGDFVWFVLIHYCIPSDRTVPEMCLIFVDQIMNEKTIIFHPRGEFMDTDGFYMFLPEDNTQKLSGDVFNSFEESMLPHHEQPLWIIYLALQKSSLQCFHRNIQSHCSGIS